MDPMLWVAVGVAVLLLSVAGGVMLMPKVRKQQQKVLLYQAICAAFKLSERCVDVLGDRLLGVDKAAAAAALYDVLPEKVRAWVTREMWISAVQGAYDEFLEFYGGVDERLDAEFEKWAAAWKPESEAMW